METLNKLNDIFLLAQYNMPDFVNQFAQLPAEQQILLGIATALLIHIIIPGGKSEIKKIKENEVPEFMRLAKLEA